MHIASMLSGKAQAGPALSWLVFIITAAAMLAACTFLCVILIRKIKALLKKTEIK